MRRCRRFPWIIRELWRYPLFEELRPIPLLKLTGLELRDIGALVEDSLVRRHTRAEVTQLLEDLLEDALGPDGKVKLEAFGREFGRVSAADAGLAALGAITIATGALVVEFKGQKEVDGPGVFGEAAKKAAASGVQRYLEQARNDLRKMDQLISAITR